MKISLSRSKDGCTGVYWDKFDRALHVQPLAAVGLCVELGRPMRRRTPRKPLLHRIRDRRKRAAAIDVLVERAAWIDALEPLVGELDGPGAEKLRTVIEKIRAGAR